jgi:hypothetical protein
MIFRALTGDGDWRWGSGKASYARDNNAIILDLETTLKTFLGECFFYPNFGQPWFDLINELNKDIVVLSIKSAIQAVAGVLSISEIEYTYTTSRELTIKYNIATTYNAQTLGTVII